MKQVLYLVILGSLFSACKKQASCDDGILNGSEIRVDCGGSCEVCPTCFDGVQNQGETSVDCGGPCTSCPPQWQVLNLDVNENLNDIAFFDDAQTGIIVGDNGLVLRSTDGGATWQKQSLGTNDLKAIFIQGQTAYVSGRSSLYIGASKASSWVEKTAPVNNWNDVWFFDNLNGVMVGDSLWAIRTTDGGNTWISEVRDFFNPTPFGSLSFISNQGGVAGANSRLFITSNGGKSWSMASTNADSAGGIGLISDVIMVNSNRTMIVAEQGMFVSNNNVFWLNKGYDIRSGELNHIDDLWLYAGASANGNSGVVYFSDDGGVAWTQENLPADAPAQFGLAFVSEDLAIAVGRNGSAFQRVQAAP